MKEYEARNPMPDIRELDRVYVPQFEGGRVIGWVTGHVRRVTKTTADLLYVVEIHDGKGTEHGYTRGSIECGYCHGDTSECGQCGPREVERLLLASELPGT